MAEKSDRKGKQLGLYVSAEAAEKLKSLSAQTDVPQSRLLRQALQLLFDKYADVLGHKAQQESKVRSRRKSAKS
jgi:predicted DNA-binding protein